MAQKPTLKPGCFSTKFPSTEWTEIPCSSAPPLPHPLRLGQGAVSTGGGAGNSPIVSVPPSHPITSISGFLAQVSGVTSESDPTGAGRWSLQLNANQFNSPLCGGQAGCSGWQQFIADNPGNVYIQYWLVGHANPCPATPPGFPPGPPGRFSPALRGKRLAATSTATRLRDPNRGSTACRDFASREAPRQSHSHRPTKSPTDSSCPRPTLAILCPSAGIGLKPNSTSSAMPVGRRSRSIRARRSCPAASRRPRTWIPLRRLHGPN